MMQFYKAGRSLIAIGEKFNITKPTLSKILIRRFGKREYKEFAKKHNTDARSKNMLKVLEQQETLWKKRGYQSSWEDKFINKILQPNFKNYEIKRLFHLNGLNHSFDIAIPEFKILIEIDGDRWHGYSGNITMDKERLDRDIKINTFVKKTGWILFRFNDNTLRKMGII